MTMVVKEIDSRSAGRIVGALGVVLALLGSVIIALLAAATAIAGSQGPNLIFALATLLWAPVVYGLTGYLAGWWLAAFYNLGADLVGGLKLELAPATPEENPSDQWRAAAPHFGGPAMNHHDSQSWTDRAAQAVFPLALGLSVAALILALADGDAAAIAIYSFWLACLTILGALRVWILRFVRKLSGEPGQPGRELLSVDLPPTTGRWSIGTVGLTLVAVSYALGAFSDLVLDGEPFQREHVGELAIVAGLFAILFGHPRPFGPLHSHRVVLAENGMLLTAPGLVEIFQPWENLVDFYWRKRGNGWILFFHARRYPGGPTWPIPQLNSIELGPIDDDTRQQIDAVLRERIPPQTPEPTSPAHSHSSGT